MRATAFAIVLVLATAGLAAADEGAALVVQGTMLSPIGEKGRVSESYGWGAEVRIVPDDPLTMSFGGYAAIGARQGEKDMRDVYTFGYDVAWTPGKRGSALRPFLGVGLDVLWINSRFADGRDPLRGTTLGVHARAGAIHSLSRRWLLQVSASYLGAIVPGTGDDLGGLVLQAGLGKTFDD
jgi:hypothetical protein